MNNDIYVLLIAKNMTQTELGRKVGVKRSYINRIINRKITPTVPLATKIAQALNTTVEEVFFLS
jgi:putative transcriptional regulator